MNPVGFALCFFFAYIILFAAILIFERSLH